MDSIAVLKPLDFLLRKPCQFGNQTDLEPFCLHGSGNISLSFCTTLDTTSRLTFGYTFGPAFCLGSIDNVVIIPFGNHIVFVFEFLLRCELRYLARLEQPLERLDLQLFRKPVQCPHVLQRIAPLVNQTPALVQFLVEAVQLYKSKKNCLIYDFPADFFPERIFRYIPVTPYISVAPVELRHVGIQQTDDNPTVNLRTLNGKTFLKNKNVLKFFLFYTFFFF